MCDAGETRNDKLAAITAAMEDGTGLAAIPENISGHGFLMWELQKSMQ